MGGDNAGFNYKSSVRGQHTFDNSPGSVTAIGKKSSDLVKFGDLYSMLQDDKILKLGVNMNRLLLIIKRLYT